MKPITRIITFIVLVGTYMIMPYPEGRFIFYIILALAFIKVVDVGMKIKEGFDEIYDYLNQQLQNQSNQDKK